VVIRTRVHRARASKKILLHIVMPEIYCGSMEIEAWFAAARRRDREWKLAVQ